MVDAVSNQLPVLWRGGTLQPSRARDDSGTVPVPGAEDYRQLAAVPPVKRRTEEEARSEEAAREQRAAEQRATGQTTATQASGTRPSSRPVAGTEQTRPAQTEAPDSGVGERNSRAPPQPAPTFTGYRPLDSGATRFTAQTLSQDTADAGGSLPDRQFRERAAQSYRRAAALPANPTYSQVVVV